MHWNFLLECFSYLLLYFCQKTTTLLFTLYVHIDFSSHPVVQVAAGALSASLYSAILVSGFCSIVSSFGGI